MTMTVELTIPQLLDAMAVTVLEGKSGEVEIRRSTVTEDEARRYNMLSSFSFSSGYGRRQMTPGTYTALYREKHLWMSDTMDERRDHVWFVKGVADRGDRNVLVTGLGLGMVVQALALLPSVERVTVVELDEDVIKLLAPHLGQVYGAAGKWLDIVHGDAIDPKLLKTLPDIHWDAAWHDIWPDICGDNWEDMKVMRRKWRSRVTLQEFWMERDVRNLARRDRQFNW